MKTKAKRTYAELQTTPCIQGDKHRVFLSMTGDGHPAFCVICGDWAEDVPPEEYEDM